MITAQPCYSTQQNDIARHRSADPGIVPEWIPGWEWQIRRRGSWYRLGCRDNRWGYRRNWRREVIAGLGTGSPRGMSRGEPCPDEHLYSARHEHYRATIVPYPLAARDLTAGTCARMANGSQHSFPVVATAASQQPSHVVVRLARWVRVGSLVLARQPRPSGGSTVLGARPSRRGATPR